MNPVSLKILFYIFVVVSFNNAIFTLFGWILGSSEKRYIKKKEKETILNTKTMADISIDDEELT